MGKHSVASNDTDVNTVAIENLKLASWLLFHKQKLLQRLLLSDGHIRYIFKESADLPRLIEAWSIPEQSEAFSHYATIVSREIRRAVKIRRSSGMPTRLRSGEK